MIGYNNNNNKLKIIVLNLINNLHCSYIIFMYQEDLRAPLVKKELIAGKDITRLTLDKDTSTNYDNVDMDHVYIQFKEEFHKWAEGNKIVKKVTCLTI